MSLNFKTYIVIALREKYILTMENRVVTPKNGIIIHKTHRKMILNRPTNCYLHGGSLYNEYSQKEKRGKWSVQSFYIMAHGWEAFIT